MDEQAEQRLTYKRNFGDFLDNDHGYGEYADKVAGLLSKENIEGNRLRLEVDLQDLQNYNANMHRQLLSSPGDCIAPFEEALEELVRNNNQKQLKEHQHVHIGFTGEFGPHRWDSWCHRYPLMQLPAACQQAILLPEFQMSWRKVAALAYCFA